MPVVDAWKTELNPLRLSERVKGGIVMKSSMTFLIISAMILAVALPGPTRAQDDGIDPNLTLKMLADGVWNASANFRAQVESRYNVTLTKEHAWRTLKALFPKTTAAAEADLAQRTGWVLEELDNGYVRINTYWKDGSKQGSLAGARTIVGRWLPLTYALMLITLNQLADDFLEDGLVTECVSQGNPLAGCQDDANALTDSIRNLEDIPCVLQHGVGDDTTCISDVLNEIERVKEHRPRHEPFQEPGIRTPPPAGMTPQEVGRHPCPGGSNHEIQTPIAPQSPPGSNGTAGSFDGGTITVTTTPSACT